METHQPEASKMTKP